MKKKRVLMRPSPILVASLVGMASMTKVTPILAFVGPQHLPNVKVPRHGMTLSYSSDNTNISGSADAKFIRLVPRTVRGSRQCFDIQTAVTSFERIAPITGERQQIDLHAQLHFGQEDYYAYYSSIEFGDDYDGVLYELVIDEALLNAEGGSGLRYLRGGNGIMASSTDQQTASQYGLTCQVDATDYTREKWIHADLTRQEILAESNSPQEQRQQQAFEEPIWALASTAPTWPGAEAVAALFRPSTPSTSLSTPVTRRLFSNLFLPGNTLAGLLRALFWLTVPSPELSVMLLDWSSILPQPTGGVSQVAMPVLESLFTGNLQEARQLVFGQMLVNGQSSSSDEKVLIGKRNEQAIHVLKQCLKKNDGNIKYALLYGGMHCPDLQKRLASMGFSRTKTTWRTAWSVQVPSFGTGKGDAFSVTSSPTAIAIGLVILPLYFCIGGLDWISTLQEVASSVDGGSVADALFVLGLYLVRHVMLYLGLAKFVVEWDGGRNLFD